MRSPFPFDTDYKNQSLENIANDFDELLAETKIIQRYGEIFRNHNTVPVNGTLDSVFRQVFSLADRIAEFGDGRSREIRSTPTLFLISSLLDAGRQAYELQERIGHLWRQEKGYQLPENSIERRFYGELRDYCYSMTDCELIGDELMRRFSNNGVIIDRAKGKMVLIINFCLRHLGTIATTVLAAWIIYLLQWN